MEFVDAHEAETRRKEGWLGCD